MAKRRPAGILLLCLIMVWLSVAAFWNAWLVLRGAEFLPVYMTPIMIAYGFAAMATVVGLWSLRHWVLNALKVWMFVCGLLILGLGFYFNILVTSGILGLFGLTIFVAVLFGFVYGYVEKTVTQTDA